MSSLNRSRRGQAMLIAVLSLGGAMIGAIAVAGLLIVYQVRASTDSLNSAKAIFAADTGINYALFDDFCAAEDFAGQPRCVDPGPVAPSQFSNGASVAVTCYDILNDPVTCYNDPGVQYAVAIGSSLQARRGFFLNMDVATATFP